MPSTRVISSSQQRPSVHSYMEDESHGAKSQPYNQCDKACRHYCLPSWLANTLKQAADKVLRKLPGLVTASAREADEVTLSFVHKLLAMDLDTRTQAQLLQAWLPACGTPSLQAWQSFLGTCCTSQVFKSRIVDV